VDSSKEEEESRVEEEMTVSKKRGRPSKKDSGAVKEMSSLTQLRCYFNISVKPLIPESFDELRLSPS
jgi:hypothetical protein